MLPCSRCQGSGYEREGEPHSPFCSQCNGKGNHPCESRGCENDAIGFDCDGMALCEDCLSDLANEEWAEHE